MPKICQTRARIACALVCVYGYYLTHQKGSPLSLSRVCAIYVTSSSMKFSDTPPPKKEVKELQKKKDKDRRWVTIKKRRVYTYSVQAPASIHI